MSLDFKKHMIEHFEKELMEKILLCKKALEDIKNDISNETKSSAGDKFETSREMMQQEREKNELQLQRLSKTLDDLSKTHGQKSHKVENGALIKSGSKYIFFISGLSNINMQDIKVFTAAITSPIGQKLKGMTVGMQTEFNGLKYSIDEIF